jgi:trehalose 6-phosphate phosphatase
MKWKRRQDISPRPLGRLRGAASGGKGRLWLDEGSEAIGERRSEKDSSPALGKKQESAALKHFPRYAFRAWREIRAHLRSADHLALFLDFDGTLVNLRNHPKDVRVPAEVPRVLTRLVQHGNVSVALVSGRSVASLRVLLDVEGVRYFGLQGTERDGKPPALRKAAVQHLSLAKREAQTKLRKLPGIWIEDKKPIFSVHYRRASASTIRTASEVLAAILERHGNALHTLNGNCVWEVLPAEIRGKSAAPQAVLPRLTGKIASIYIGDDGTDEVAFAALPGQITVRVGEKRRTRACFYLHDPADVLRFLSRVEELLSAGRLPE